MGGKSSGWLSDCSLMVDEFKYVDGKIKGGFRDEAMCLRFFRRYRDDCTSLNVDGFMDVAREIYPPSLTLTQENDQSECANVLDMNVKIQNSSIITKVYCKADDFPFLVISLPFLKSNLDDRLCYRVFYGQIIRYQRLSTLREDFEIRVNMLAWVLLRRDYKRFLLLRQFCSAVEKYISEFQKWILPSDFKVWFDRIISLNNV